MSPGSPEGVDTGVSSWSWHHSLCHVCSVFIVVLPSAQTPSKTHKELSVYDISVFRVSHSGPCTLIKSSYVLRILCCFHTMQVCERRI